jgi:hypothetical protein
MMTTLSIEINQKAVRGHERAMTLFRRDNVSGARRLYEDVVLEVKLHIMRQG